MYGLLKKWALPISMLIGALSYYTYISIPFLDFTHAIVRQALSIVQPLLIFCMLFVSFCRTSPEQMRPHRWMIAPLLIQCLSFLLMGYVLAQMPDMTGRTIVESAMICMICPTATAASVVTMRLHGNQSAVVSYTVLINLAASVLIPAVVPFIHIIGHENITFLNAFILILCKVFPLLIFPLALAWTLRKVKPDWHATVSRHSDLSFKLWIVALSIAIGVTCKAIHHSDEPLWELVGIAIVSLLCCLFQFAAGHLIGKNFNETIAATQSFGQKNTVFAIWMGYTFMSPVTALAGGFYSIWHNVINSYQLAHVNSQKAKQGGQP